jgi:Mce-associated membrane protein
VGRGHHGKLNKDLTGDRRLQLDRATSTKTVATATLKQAAVTELNASAGTAKLIAVLDVRESTGGAGAERQPVERGCEPHRPGVEGQCRAGGYAANASRATLLPVLAGMAVLALGCALWFGFQAQALESGGNRALVDAAATSQVSEEISASVKAIFSYDYSNLARTERAAGDVLVDAAVRQYGDSFTAAKRQAEEQKLVRTTTVRAVGVTVLSGDQAAVLLFLDQQTLHTVGNQ